MINWTALTVMPRDILEKKSTKRLLSILRAVRDHHSYHREWDADRFTCKRCNSADLESYRELLKSILATREHLPRKAR